jgi:hypothetical protein
MNIMDEARAKVRQQTSKATAPVASPIDDLSYRPFPIEWLPDPIKGFVDAGSRAMRCDPCYIALPLLCAVASMIGNTRRLMLKKSWFVPPILWAAIVGESGTLKSPAFRLSLQALRRRQEMAFRDHQAAMSAHDQAQQEYERDLASWKKSKTGDTPPKPPTVPVCLRHIVNDVTIEALAPILRENPRGLLLEADELAGWFGSFDRYTNKSGDVARWLSIFNADAITIDRKTAPVRVIHVPRPSVCVVGGIQPAILKKSLTDEHRQNGLAARLLLVSPPRVAKQWTEADIDDSEHQKIEQLFNLLAELDFDRNGDDLKPEIVKLDQDAKGLWVSYYNAHNQEQADLEGDMAAAWSKLEEYAARLALVLHFVRWASGETLDSFTLDALSMQMGIMLTEWFKIEAKRVYAMLDESTSDEEQRKLLEFIRRKGGTVTPRDVQRGVWSLRHADPVTELEQLKALGWGDWVNVCTTENGGRPTTAFRLNTPSTPRHLDETPSMVKSSRRNPQNSAENRGFVDVETVEKRETQGVSSRGFVEATTETRGSSHEQDDILGI